MPIGNLTSQFFANVYLNALDQFIKHHLKARFYARYVDDLVLVNTDPEILYFWQGEIERFLEKELKLSINRCVTLLAPVSGGVDFVKDIWLPVKEELERFSLRLWFSKKAPGRFNRRFTGKKGAVHHSTSNRERIIPCQRAFAVSVGKIWLIGL